MQWQYSSTVLPHEEEVLIKGLERTGEIHLTSRRNSWARRLKGLAMIAGATRTKPSTSSGFSMNEVTIATQPRE
jgi:hypothetical protein